METSYYIKVPVFATNVMRGQAELFDDMANYEQMVDTIVNKISAYRGTATSFRNKNKTKEFVIKDLSASSHTLVDRPCLLVRISAYSTNLLDGYFESNEKITFGSGDKVGSDNYFMLLCPMIAGIDSSMYTRYFLVLVYEDPNKDDEELLWITKYVMRKILGVPIRSMKLQSLLEELKKIHKVPELKVNFFSMSNSEDMVDAKYRSYVVENKVRRTRILSFKDMPADTVIDLIEDDKMEEDYQSKSIKWSIGKKDYKISQQLQEAKQAFSTTVEKIFNEKIPIPKADLDKIYEPNFIVEKLNIVLGKYMYEEFE